MNFYAAYIKWMTDWFTVANQVNNAAIESTMQKKDKV